MLALLAPLAKAIVAGLAPLLIPFVHMLGLTEVSASGLEVSLLMGVTAGLTYFVPNKAAPAPAAEE